VSWKDSDLFEQNIPPPNLFLFIAPLPKLKRRARFRAQEQLVQAGQMDGAVPAGGGVTDEDRIRQSDITKGTYSHVYKQFS
jgi:hypothetical protein